MVNHYMAKLASRDGVSCHYCGIETITLPHNINHPQKRTLDHKVPCAQGGLTVLNNLVIACQSCNHEKGFRDYDWFKHYLKGHPYPPCTLKIRDRVIHARHGRGVVIGVCERDGEHEVRVAFYGGGTRNLLWRMGHLEPISESAGRE